MDRRAFLVILASLSGGCLSSSPLTNSTNTSTNTGSAKTPSDIPHPGDNCTVTSLPDTVYPSLPEVVTETSAQQFARDFERSYALAKIHEDPSEDPNGVDGSEASIQETTDSGYLIRVSFQINTASNETETIVNGTGVFTALGTTVSTGWYYVTPVYAMRAPENGNEILTDDDWDTVACKPSE